MQAATCGVSAAKAFYDETCLDSRLNEPFKKATPLGAPCDDIQDGTYYGECDPKLGYCGEADADAGAGSPKVCLAWQKAGEECKPASPRRFCNSSERSYCTGRTCSTPLPLRKIGENCVDGAIPRDCEAGAFCDFSLAPGSTATKTCLATKADGADCGSDEECSSNYPYSCDLTGTRTCGSTKFCGGKL
jgi:Dickkopf N-terminal cysteine-rich region